MQSIDAFMHVPDFLFRSSSDHPSTEAVGLAFFFNPTQQPIRSHIRLPLYYTGLTEFATLIFEDDPDTKAVHRLERDYSITIPVGKWGGLQEVEEKKAHFRIRLSSLTSETRLHMFLNRTRTRICHVGSHHVNQPSKGPHPAGRGVG